MASIKHAKVNSITGLILLVDLVDVLANLGLMNVQVNGGGELLRFASACVIPI